MRQNTLRIDPEIISKIYEDYISRRKGEKGKFLEEKSKELGISRYKLYKLLKSRFGLQRRNKNPHFYDIEDILYAIHLMKKENKNLLMVCHKLVGTRRITNKNHHPVKDPVRAFYLAVRRFLASRNSREKGKIRLSKTLLKRAVIISNFSEREKLALMMAIEGKYRYSEINGEMLQTVKDLISRGFIFRKNGYLSITPALKSYLLPDIERVLNNLIIPSH